MCLTQPNACSWGLPGCQAPNRWEHSRCCFSSGHHLYSLFSAPHFMLSQAQFQRRKSLLKQERLPSSAMVLHIRILGFDPTEWLFSVQTVMIHQNKTRIPLQIVMQGVLVWRQVPITAACNKLYIPMNGVRNSSPSSSLPQPRAALQHHLWTGVSNLAAVPTHSRCRWPTGHPQQQWFIYQWIMTLWLVSLEDCSLLKEGATWQSETEHKL